MTAAGNMRAAWRSFASAGLAFVAAPREGTIEGDEQRLELAYMVKTVGKTEFPVPWASARAASAGFLHIARSILTAEPRERGFLAPSLQALAETVIAFLDAEQADALTEQRRRLAED